MANSRILVVIQIGLIFWVLLLETVLGEIYRVVDIDSFTQNRLLVQTICPRCRWTRDQRGLLSRVQRLARQEGSQGPFVPVGATNRDERAVGGSNRDLGLLSRLEPPTGTKEVHLSRV